MPQGTITLGDAVAKILGSKLYDLEQVKSHGIPTYAPLRAPFSYYLYRQHRLSYQPGKSGPRTSSSGVIVESDQTGTHIDALCHQAGDLRLCNGTVVDAKIETPFGYTQLGAETIPPLIRRGVLLDVPSLKGQDPLPERYEVNKDDLISCMSLEGVTIDRGDALLIRVGYGKFWSDPNKYARAAAVSADACPWIRELGVVAVGIDNLSWDIPEVCDEQSRADHLGHYYLVANYGIYIIENMYLEELAKDRCYKFLFIGLPIKIKGATGAPIRPIAIGVPGLTEV